MTCTGWDWHFAYILNKRFVCPKISYCDHYPEGGIHSKRDDVALNPTDFLKEENFMNKGLGFNLFICILNHSINLNT